MVRENLLAVEVLRPEAGRRDDVTRGAATGRARGTSAKNGMPLQSTSLDYDFLFERPVRRPGDRIRAAPRPAAPPSSNLAELIRPPMAIPAAAGRAQKSSSAANASLRALERGALSLSPPEGTALSPPQHPSEPRW